MRYGNRLGNFPPLISKAIKPDNLQYLLTDVLFVPISNFDVIDSFLEHLDPKDFAPLIEKIAKAASMESHQFICYPIVGGSPYLAIAKISS